MSEQRFSKSEYKKLEKELLHSPKHVWKVMDEIERGLCLSFAKEYKDFLSKAKTERESVRIISEIAERHGFSHVESKGTSPAPAKEMEKKIYWTFRGKIAALAVPGKKGLMDGIRIISSHIDAPRLDLKQNPLYEDMDMSYLKTHYYGGIKKFHWVARPLAIYGVAVKEDGRIIDVKIGDEPDDPILVINDILPHLAYKVQADKKISEAIPAEKLNVLIGGIPLHGPDELKDTVKLRVLKLLNERYGIVEEDLISAELEVVPAGPARDVGFDRAFVGGYAHDDRVCAYASLKAILELKNPLLTSIAIFLDKEEIGSDGNTGAKSRFLELVLYDLMIKQGITPSPDSLLRIFLSSRAISADVTAGIDPDYQEVHEKRNDAKMGYGICLTKYTGHKGKVAANDAHAEYLGWIRRIWNKAGVLWQAGELGKVDEGGGGTVAKYLAFHGIDVVDAGPPVLSMHSPLEILHKGDLYMTCKAYKAFYTGE